MHDPASPSSSSPEPADAVDYEVASETVGLVIAWYSRRILAVRRSPAFDPELLERLIAQHRQCVHDRERLDETSPEETARLTALYTARLQELESTGP